MQKENTYLDSIQKMRIGVIMATMTSLLLFLPASLTHAAGITFTTDPQGNWVFSSDYTGHNIFSMYVTADGRGRSAEQMNPVDTNVASTVPMEVLEADTPGGSYSNTCSSAHYTGNIALDFACNDTATQTQGFAYTQSSSPALVPQTASSTASSTLPESTTSTTSPTTSTTTSLELSSPTSSNLISSNSTRGVSGSSISPLTAASAISYLILKLPIPVLLNLLTQYQESML
jgi:hypothetical protein